MCLNVSFSILAIYLNIWYLFWPSMVMPLISSYFHNFIWQDLVKNWACSIYFLEPNIYHVIKNSLPSISHSIKMPAHHFLNFFLTYHHHKCTYSLGSFCSGLWPLSTIIWDYQIATGRHHNSSNTAVSLTALPYHHC